MAAFNGQVVLSQSIPPRPLILSLGQIEVSVLVSTDLHEWITVEVLRDDFSRSQTFPDDVDIISQPEKSYELTIELAARFLGFVAQKLHEEPQATTTRMSLLSNMLKHFISSYLTRKDVYTLTSAFDTNVRESVLSAYFQAVAALQSQAVADIFIGPRSALLSAATDGSASIFALFGGQGTNELYFDELQCLHNIYKPFVTPFLASVTNDVLVPLANEQRASNHYAHGLEVATWLNNANARPSIAYLSSVPISFPLIGLTQLIQYLVVCKVTGLTPREFRDRIAGATGHSQGIVSAVVIAASASFEDFTENSRKALKWLFFVGLRSQEAFPVVSLEPSIVQDCNDGGEGMPSPMLSITGLDLGEVETHLETNNTYLAENSKVQVSLHNGPRTFVVTGPARALYGLVTSLRKVRAASGLDQSKIPFSQRKPVFSMRFLATGVPYHSKYLRRVTEMVVNEDLGADLWQAQDLKIPILNTENGQDLQLSTTSITRSLCEQILTSPLHWSKATDFPDTATHAIDFGPGGLSGIGPLTARNLEGRGVRVIVMSDHGRGDAELYNAAEVKYEDRWSKKWSPSLVRTSDGTIYLDTPFSRLLGKPPIMVAGMTPSTVKAGFVSAILNAGYHVELAGGGHYDAAALRAKVLEIRKQIPAGVGITLNSLYINPRQFGFQLLLWQEMRKEGLPLEGFCIAGGIPSLEKAVEIINGLKDAGLKHVAFKPASVDGICQVLNIAAVNPNFPVILQWTGGRAGGHHSFEDFHQPILATYSAIRRHSNIYLVAGSGFGCAKDMWPYLTGDWSAERFDVQRMPFDGFLLASRVMVAKEAHTSPSVKDLIVATSGVDDAAWEGTYDKPTGGVLTVLSELGEPIHKVVTRSVKLWKEFDDTVFKLAKEKRAAWLNERRDEVIEKLNRDFAKPWFGCKKDGSIATDLGDMTYEEVVVRMVRLMYVSHEKRWVDVSLRNLTGDWLRRIEERFAGVDGTKLSIIQSYDSLDDPYPFIETFFKTYTLATEQLLASQDTSYFLAIAQRPGQKPVPFIPVLDASFEVWFKKDSLWAAEDIEAVFDRDPQRVCILQGPVAARASIVKDEPIKDLLGNINKTLIQRLLEHKYSNDESLIPTVDYLSEQPTPVADELPSVRRSESKDSVTYELGNNLPDSSAWLETLASPALGWLRALVASPMIVQGTLYIDNPMRRILVPRAGQKVIVASSSITIYGGARSYGPHKSEFKALEIQYNVSTNAIDVTMYEDRRDVSVSLTLQFQYKPSFGFAPIHEVAADRNTRIKEFYWKVWYGDNEVLPSLDPHETFVGPEVTIEAAAVEEFCAVVGNQGESFKTARNDNVQAPMDFAIVIGWKALLKSLFPASIDGDLLKLVHISNSFCMVDGAEPLRVGDVCRSTATILSVVNTNEGKIVKARGHIYRGDEQVIEIVSAFLYHGHFTDYENTFEISEADYVVPLDSEAAIGVLESKAWFAWSGVSEPLSAGTSLIFHITSEAFFKDRTSYRSVNVSGDVFLRNQLGVLVKAGSVQLQQEDSRGNPVLAYLQRHGSLQRRTVPLPDSGYTLTNMGSTVFAAPSTNEPYSKVSGDFNPIHINPYFSDYASLPSTITHGLWSSAATRRYIENVVGKGHPIRVLAYNVSFVGIVSPNDELDVKVRHIGMRDGNIVVKIETFNNQGEKVLDGFAEVSQPTTAYIFTGQGSQQVGMGMDLYNSSPAARAVWESADAYLLAVYGFSIIEIVKGNPKTKTIHFGGAKGHVIRQRYMDMTYDTIDQDGGPQTLPIFPDIDVRTPKHTFSHPDGLLFVTQFAQIALVVTEKTAFEDMQANGLVQKDCAFAGHSLGEFSALASIADVFPVSTLVDICFYRGITMERAIRRDAQNRSNYAMCAVNPSRISASFGDATLKEMVESIAVITDSLLEIVNYNIEGQQYVCAGELIALQTMTNVLNFVKLQKIDGTELTETRLEDVVKSCYAEAANQQQAEGYIKLERGVATVPLPGIDVPFHSGHLRAGVTSFRAHLLKKIDPTHLKPDMLIGKYIPNLVAKPFDVSREYIQIIYYQTSSPHLDTLLKNWDHENWASVERRQMLAYVILIELLAYQLASPVRWIETQDWLFTEFQFDRLIEFGPSPVLTTMAIRTLKAKYTTRDDAIGHSRTFLCHAKDVREIYYQYKDELISPADEDVPIDCATPGTCLTVQEAATVDLIAASNGSAVVEDVPIKTLDILTVIVAQKLKKRVGEIAVSKSIRDLAGGKSTLQNEILGDLQEEFASAPDRGEEMSLVDLASCLSIGFSGSLGRYSNGLVSRLISGKMPGGFTAAAMKAYLAKHWGLGSSRASSVLLLATTVEPPKRLASDAEAKTWLDGVVSVYAQRAGVSLVAPNARGPSDSAAGLTFNSEEFLKFQAQQERLAAQHVDLYMRYLGRDSRAGEAAFDQEKARSTALQAKLDDITKEHGDTYTEGIRPRFDRLKARHFDSYWNWMRQDALLTYYDIISGRLTPIGPEATARYITLLNRADPETLLYLQYQISRCDPSKGKRYKLAKEFGQRLIDNMREVLGKPPVYRDVTIPTAPRNEITAAGDIVYSEVIREDVQNLEDYLEEMVSPRKMHHNFLKLATAVKIQPSLSQEPKNCDKGFVCAFPENPDFKSHLSTRSNCSSAQFLCPHLSVRSSTSSEVPLLHLKHEVGTKWAYSSNLTGVYFNGLHEIAATGTTFQDKNALLTGVGKGSIGVEIVKCLLLGGAHVVITTSSYGRKTIEYYQSIFHTFGGRGSALTVVPFNQASRQDINALVDYVYDTLGMDLDHIIPFAGIPENGREIDSLDDKSELAHRMMLVNLLRILGAVKMKKARCHFVTRPTQVILPLSPNHGLIGNDGLYSESKIGLETLFQRWRSESWNEYLCLAGAVIGWTRGTGLMGPTDTIAQELESCGVRTFSSKEMAFNILGLMHPLLSSINHVEPIWANFSGGMDRLPDLADVTARIHKTLHRTADLHRFIAQDNAADFAVIHGVEAGRLLQTVDIRRRANFQLNFPTLEAHESLGDLTYLRSLIDLEKVVVITGFAEVGPWGSARTRWEMEIEGKFTMEGCIEMAWMMGFIKHFEGRREDGSLYVGWVDNKTNEAVDDKDIKGRYEKDILAHAGIRLVEPQLFYGYDPNKKVSNQEVQLMHDLEPLEIAESEAQKFKLQHGEKCDIWAGENDQWFVKLKKGACIFIPKAIKFNRTVAAQIPTGWDARRYGIPDDVVTQVDRITLWALVCTAEALNMAGITDPYELYRHVHPSEVGTALGSGMGGVTSMSKLFKGRQNEQDIQKDILQETFINTIACWINLLLMSSSGPVKIPVGACATALQSLEIASDTILSGKAKVMLAGGFDDISEEGSYEFANMKATSNAEAEFAMGREPAEMSRPATTSRAGFMEAQGAGVHVLMNAKTALELGAPIRGILAFTSTSTDKAGRSIPAPGRGALSVAREVPSTHPLPILDVAYRSRQLSFRRAQISQWLAHEHVQLQEELDSRKAQGDMVDGDYFASRVVDIENDAAQQEKDALAMYGMLEGSDPRVAPLRRALAIWGLKLDDIDVLSIHGTGTSANEENETKIWNDIFTTLSRSPGNAVPVIAQKSLTGHAKGGSAAWQMTGLLQTLETGIIPGHRTSDNIDSRFRDRTFLMFPSKSIHTDGIRAGVMSSFGFGQVGGIALVLHPRYLFGTLDPAYYQQYKKRNLVRSRQSYKAMSEMMIKNSLVKVKDRPPYVGDMESEVLLNSLARATLDSKTGEYSFEGKLPTGAALDTSNVKVANDIIEAREFCKRSSGACAGVGVDQELISAVPSHNPTFVARNFTDAEITYCQAQPSPASSFAARWVGKEAVFKSLGVKSNGAAASLRDIEILNDPETGAPTVTLHGDARAQAAARGINNIAISLSHSETVAIAFAQASS